MKSPMRAPSPSLLLLLAWTLLPAPAMADFNQCFRDCDSDNRNKAPGALSDCKKADPENGSMGCYSNWIKGANEHCKRECSAGTYYENNPKQPLGGAAGPPASDDPVKRDYRAEDLKIDFKRMKSTGPRPPCIPNLHDSNGATGVRG